MQNLTSSTFITHCYINKWVNHKLLSRSNADSEYLQSSNHTDVIILKITNVLV